MKAYFKSLNPREQKLVLAAGFFVLLFLPYQFIYTPFQESLTKMQKSAAIAQKNIAWMNSQSQEVQKLKHSGGLKPANGKLLLTLVETTMKQNKLNKNLRKAKPAGSSNVIVWLDDVPFDRLMQWLDSLVVTHGLSIQEITVEKQSDKGIVNAKINMSTE